MNQQPGTHREAQTGEEDLEAAAGAPTTSQRHPPLPHHLDIPPSVATKLGQQQCGDASVPLIASSWFLIVERC